MKARPKLFMSFCEYLKRLSPEELRRRLPSQALELFNAGALPPELYINPMPGIKFSAADLHTADVKSFE